MAEFKRVFQLKLVLVIVLLLLVNMLFFLYKQIGGKTWKEFQVSNNQYEMLLERYKDLPVEDAYKKATRESGAISTYAASMDENNEKKVEFNIEKYDADCKAFIYYYQSLSDTEQNNLKDTLKEVRNKLKYVGAYHENIATILGNADKYKEFQVFSDTNSFSYHNIIQSAKDYSRVAEVAPSLDYDRGVSAFHQYSYMQYFAFAIIVMIIYSLFGERENGMWPMVRNTPNGRAKLAFQRMLIVVGSTVGVSFLFYFSTFVLSMFVYGGFGDLSGAVQSMEEFSKYTLPYSKIHYIVNYFCLSTFLLCAVSLILWMIFVIFRNRKYTLVFVAVFVCLEIILYQKILPQSVYNAFKYINLVNFLSIGDLYSGYLNWGIHTYVISVVTLIVISMAVLSVVAICVAIVGSVMMRPFARKSIIQKFTEKIYKIYQRIFYYFPVTGKEFHKLIITGKGVFVIATMVFTAFYFSNNSHVYFTDERIQMDLEYQMHGGSDYSKIVEKVNTEVERLDMLSQKADEALVQYNNNQITKAQYNQTESAVTLQREVVKSLDEYQNKIVYLDNIRQEYGINGYMISDRGYEEFFGEMSKQRELILLLTLIIGIVIVVSESISIEFKTGMENIVRSSVRGRQWLLARKVFAALLYTSVIFIIIYGIDIYYLNKFYDFPYMNDAPLMSLTFMKGCAYRGTIYGWIQIIFVKRAIVCVVTMLIALFASRLSKKNKILMPLVLVALIVIVVILFGKGVIV